MVQDFACSCPVFPVTFIEETVFPIVYSGFLCHKWPYKHVLKDYESLYLHFHLFPGIFFISSLISSVTYCWVAHCLASMHLCFFHVVDFQFHSIMVGKDAWCDFSLLKIYWDLYCGLMYDLSWRMFHVHLGRRYILMFVDRMFSISIKPIWANVSFEASVSLLTFCLGDLFTGVSGVLKAPAGIVRLSVSHRPSLSCAQWPSVAS